MPNLEYKGGLYAPAADVGMIDEGLHAEILVPVDRATALSGSVPYKPLQRWWLQEPWYLPGADKPNGKRTGKFKYLFAGDELPKDGKWMPAKDMPPSAARVFVRIDAVKVCRVQALTTFDAHRMGFSDRSVMLEELLPRFGDGFVTAMQVTALHYT